MKTLATAALLVLGVTGAAHAAQQITVYKTPSCGCCKKWVSYLEDNGYQVTAKDMPNLSFVKSMSGVKPQYASCHTAVIDGYVVEGHVPTADIERMLKERPDIIGISAPGMPVGSPGMEQGDRRDNYQTITLEKDGTARVYAEHGPAFD